MKLLIAIQMVFYSVMIGFIIRMWIDHNRMNKRHETSMKAHRKVVETLNKAQNENWPAKKLYYQLLSVKEQIGSEAADNTMITLMIQELKNHVE